MQIKESVPLAPYATFKIGGPAKFFCEAANKTELKNAMSWAKEKSLPIFILGGGSNILVSDDGFDGLVVRNAVKGIDASGSLITAGAGENWDDFVGFAVSRNFAGAECLSGIPGTVGAAPVQNIGAYGQSAAEIIERVYAVDLKTGEERVFKSGDCGFGYRTSVFSAKGGSASGGKKNPGAHAVTAVSFLLKQDGAPTLKYHELKNYFAGNAAPSLSQTRNAVLEIRSKKGMVATGEELHSSAGSFFINPVILETALDALKSKVEQCKKIKNCCADPWFWLKTDGKVKISAACLIECAGFEKGIKIGNVGISQLHSLALVNYGGATAAEILSFSGDIQTKVLEKFGIALEIEPQLIGF